MAKKINQKLKKILLDRQVKALRDPADVLCGNYNQSGLAPESLSYKADESFIILLKKLNITLFVTREYEHLVIALSPQKGKFLQSFVHLPHPSGLVTDKKSGATYIATTRNPNQVFEFRPLKTLADRRDRKLPKKIQAFLMPTRSKFLCGSTYLHDMALINGKLYANSVGQNGIIKVELGRVETDEPVWWPRCIINKGRQPHSQQNYIQLNSIASGSTLERSFFSASSDCVSSRRPGHLNYPVNKCGVIFDGHGEVIARGLTRPHSARIAAGRLWVANSGYGEFGYIEKGRFISVVSLPGWTRGLSIINDIAFIGVSRVIPKYKRYAPGLANQDICGVYAFDVKKAKILGSISWPYGNQIFAIDWLSSRLTPGFIFEQVKELNERSRDIFYSYRT